MRREVERSAEATGPETDWAGGATTDRGLVRVLAGLISATLAGLGILSIASGHYDGRTTLRGGHEISLDGGAATLMGLGTILLGLLPLALWFGSARRALAWSLTWGAAAVVSYGAAFVLHRP